MQRKTRLVAIAGLACLLSGYVLIESLATEQPTLGELLHVPPLSTTHRLYPGATSTVDFAVDFLSPEGVVVRRHVNYKDGTVEEILMQPDGRRPSSSKTFYAIAPGESTRRLAALRRYGPDGKDIVFEDLRRLSGLRERSNVVGPDGNRTIIDFAEDGRTHLREQLLKRGGPGVISDIRYREDESHSVSYSNILDSDGKLRTVTEFDERGNTLRTLVTDSAGMINDSRLQVFDPQTLKLRFKAEGTWGANTITVFRDDSTVERVETIDYNELVIKYFDKTGTRVHRIDNWFHSESGVVKAKDEVSYRPYHMTFLNESGKPVRRLAFVRYKLATDSYFNVTENGVTYAEKRFHYSAEGFLEKVDYVAKGTDGKEVVVRSIKHDVAEGIKANVTPELIAIPAREPFLGVMVPDPPEDR